MEKTALKPEFSYFYNLIIGDNKIYVNSSWIIDMETETSLQS